MKAVLKKTNEIINENKLTSRRTTAMLTVISRLRNFDSVIPEMVGEGVSAVSIELEI